MLPRFSWWYVSLHFPVQVVDSCLCNDLLRLSFHSVARFFVGRQVTSVTGSRFPFYSSDDLIRFAVACWLFCFVFCWGSECWDWHCWGCLQCFSIFFVGLPYYPRWSCFVVLQATSANGYNNVHHDHSERQLSNVDSTRYEPNDRAHYINSNVDCICYTVQSRYTNSQQGLADIFAEAQCRPSQHTKRSIKQKINKSPPMFQRPRWPLSPHLLATQIVLFPLSETSQLEISQQLVLVSATRPEQRL
jgi:hypothetical protein